MKYLFLFAGLLATITSLSLHSAVLADEDKIVPASPLSRPAPPLSSKLLS